MIISVRMSPDVRVELNALSRYVRKIDEIETVDLVVLAEKIRVRAMELAPKGSGKLESGVYARVSGSKTRPGINAGAVVHSDRGYNYAPIQHENESFQHPNGGQAKFVAKALQELIPPFIKQAKEKLSSVE